MRPALACGGQSASNSAARVDAESDKPARAGELSPNTARSTASRSGDSVAREEKGGLNFLYTLPVKPMLLAEAEGIVSRAAELFDGAVRFEPGMSKKIAEIGQGYPYFVQLIEFVNPVFRQYVRMRKI